jgi:hypothetical protein
MNDARGNPNAREYLWFALLLIVVLATSAAHSTGSARLTTPRGAVAP